MLRDLVEQETTTTGTGTYTVSGSVDGRRTFASAFGSDRKNLSYVVTDDAGNFECGYGDWNQLAFTLTRSAVLSSSNANAAVNWAAGTKRIYLADHAGSRQFAARHNSAYDGSLIGYITGFPTASHNRSMGFDQGSVWYGLERRLSCQSVDDFSGNASWRLDVQSEWLPITAGGGKTVFFGRLVDGDGYDHSYRGATFSAAQAVGNNTPGGSGYYIGVADASLIPLCTQTTDATPTFMGVDALNAIGDAVLINTPGCATVTGTISAFESSTGDVASWKVEAVLKCDSGYIVSVAVGGTPTNLHSDAGLSTASCVVEPHTDGSGGFTIKVTGVAGKTITWSAGLLVTIAGDGN